MLWIARDARNQRPERTTFLRMKAAPKILSAKLAAPGHAVLVLNGDIGNSESWWSGEPTGLIDLKLVQKAIKELGSFDSLEVQINTLGGDAYQGLAIGNYLRSLGVKTTAKVIGVCASAGAYIALLCDSLEMPANSQLMIHEARAWPSGPMTVAECEALKNQCTATNESCVVTCVEKTGLSASDIRTLMAAETWMLGDEAKAKGFADVVSNKIKLAAAPKSSAKLHQFKNAPANVVALLADSGDSTMPESNTDSTTPADSTPVQSATSTSPSAAGSSPPAAVPAPSTATVAPVASAPDGNALEAAKLAGRRDEMNRQNEIRAKCREAGPQFAALADEYCSDPKWTPRDVEQRLFQEMCKLNTAPSQGATGTNVSGNQPADEYAVYRKEFTEQKAASPTLYASITEEQYVASRCREEGKPVPVKP